jgi:hypothetical protein
MQFSAITPVAGEIRRIFFDAESHEEAVKIAAACNAGLEGEACRPVTPVPVAFGVQEARELLGGISRATIYAWLALGRLERVPNTRRLLVTRESIERAVQAG